MIRVWKEGLSQAGLGGSWQGAGVGKGHVERVAWAGQGWSWG